MKCRYCLADDSRFFEEGICRRCIHLRFDEIDYDIKIRDSDYLLSFELTSYQKKVSKDLLDAIRLSNVFLEAVCGAGKTEICYEMIKCLLNEGKKVGWAIPRRQVVIELGERIKSNFNNLKVVYVCEGYTEDILGDLVICTTHQLFRYHNYFDYLIVDEPDAYPFSNSDLLKGIMLTSFKKHVVFMSATYDTSLLDILGNFTHLRLPLRPNLKPLPIPYVRRTIFEILIDLKKNKERKNLIFVPTKRIAKYLSILFKIPCITSKTIEKDRIIDCFRNGDINTLISTTVLERGVTFENCFVYVLWADHPVFNRASLIQISGRVMRGKSTVGECYFHSFYRSKEVEACILNLEENNRLALSVLKK